MKIIRVFGVVVGIHLFALLLIFANPGCSSTSKPAPAPADTVTPAPAAPIVSVPLPNAAPSASDGGSALSAAPIGFDPSAPAVAGVRFPPTRPGTPAASALEAAPVADVTPAVAYVVKSGDNLWNLAKKNHISVSELAAANNLKAGTALRPGQKLIIPGKASTGGTAAAAAPTAKTTAGPTTAAAPKPAGDTTTHTVKMGEALGTIGSRNTVCAKATSPSRTTSLTRRRSPPARSSLSPPPPNPRPRRREPRP